MFVRIWIIGWAIFTVSFSEVYKIETETLSAKTFHEETFKNITDSSWSYLRSSRWSEWSEWSACTRSCDGGVMTQTRKCLESHENGRKSSSKQLNLKRNPFTRSQCLGPSKRTKICNNEACPPGTKDFRNIQCEYYNSNAFAGIYYTWEAYYEEQNQCALNCRPLGYKFYATLNKTVADGTSCHFHTGKKGACLDGMCQYVGCDGVIGGQKYDVCGVCGGNNSTCRLISGLFTRPELISGYNYITDIPQNACNITVSEIKKSGNSFVLRYKNGSNILNGNWASNPAGTYDAVGTKFFYSKGNSELGEFVFSPGPTSHPLELLLFYRQPNPGIKYEYRVAMPVPYHEQTPLASSFRENQNYRSDTRDLHKHEDSGRRKKYSSNTANSFSESSAEFQGVVNDEDMKPKSKSNKKRKFLWKLTGYTPCTKTCGGGTRTAIYSCVKEGNQQHVVAEKRCIASDKPENQEDRCSNKPCPAKWVVGEWGQCSVTCGEGVESREITCKQEISAVLAITVSDEACLTSLSPNLLRTKPCFRKPCPDGSASTVKPYWRTGTWSTCSSRCGMGIKTRAVRCMAESEDECSREDRPANEMVCDMGPCAAQGTYEWLTTDWSQQCTETCGLGTQTRRVICLESSQRESLCDKIAKPETSRNCSSSSGCGGRWFSSPWSRCSADCGWGKQVRTAICVAYNTATKGYSIAPTSHCVEKEKPSSEQACLDRPCNPQWFAASWSACTRSCDSGVQRREVRCINEDLKPSIDCKEEEKPATRRSCNTQRCAIYSDAKEADSNVQETQTEAASQNVVSNDVKNLTGNLNCTDKQDNCHLVAQARLCNYKYYKTFCCASCYSLYSYNSPTNSTIASANH